VLRGERTAGKNFGKKQKFFTNALDGLKSNDKITKERCLTRFASEVAITISQQNQEPTVRMN
jgi:hypothetical protein